MEKTKKQKKPYSERNDLEKIKSNWNKTRGLYNRKEWSGAIVRAATAVEIAANLVVREELEVKLNLDKQFVDSLLKWSNGIKGKFEHLILPLLKSSENFHIFNESYSNIKEINDKRNSIVHSGQFNRKSTAKKIINLSKKVIESLVQQYTSDFELKDIK